MNERRVLGLGEHADEQCLFLVEVVGSGGSATSLEAFTPKLPIPFQFNEISLDQVGLDLARVLHLRPFGQVGIQNAGLFIDGVEGQFVLGHLAGCHLLLTLDIPTILADRGEDFMPNPTVESLGCWLGAGLNELVEPGFGDDVYGGSVATT